jgi:hypothetical protein
MGRFIGSFFLSPGQLLAGTANLDRVRRYREQERPGPILGSLLKNRECFFPREFVEHNFNK